MSAGSIAGGHRDGPAQAVGHDRGDGRRRDRRSAAAGSAPTVTATRRCSRYVATVAGPGLGDRGLQRHRPAHRACGCSPTARQVVDVPPKLSARARVFATGQGRKTDATDAHSVALVGTRMAGLRPVVNDEQLAVLRVLVDRRRSLGEDHTRMVVPAAPAAAGADPRRGEEGPVRRPGQGAARHGPAPRRRRQDPPPGRRRADQRPRADLSTQEGREQGTHRAARRDRHHADGPARHRPLRRRPAAGRGRRHHPVPRPQPLRLLERHRTHRRLLRRPGAPPALPRREPADQPGPAHHGHRPAPQPRPKAAPTSTARKAARQDLDGSHALPQTTPLRHRLPAHARRRRTRTSATGPGGQRGTTLTPARPAHIPTPALRTSHFPDPPPPSLDRPPAAS